MKLLSAFYEDLADIDRRIAELEAERVDVVNRIDGFRAARGSDDGYEASAPAPFLDKS